MKEPGTLADAWGRLAKAIRDLGRAIGLVLAPDVRDFLERIADGKFWNVDHALRAEARRLLGRDD